MSLCAVFIVLGIYVMKLGIFFPIFASDHWNEGVESGKA
ncbi:hypothetical protein SB48_HM08orf03684 [Heyndrickxia coagulans]|uniref:Uncharacterized protein n=1 Tax=Heyndrickxia coagulans TaxID=1398 RepID=A0AAN0T555_HEYCO|nr:hypothetical protein SB48_HM08orf03684 [Heyndrickxia coagulans]